MRATGAENGGTVGGILLFEYGLVMSEEHAAQKICAVFTLLCEKLLAMDLQAPSANLLLYYRLQLLKYVNRFHLTDKFLDQTARQRIDQAQLKNTCVGANLFYVLICDSAGDKADLLISHFYLIYRE